MCVRHTLVPRVFHLATFPHVSCKQGRQARHIYLTQRSYDVSREVRADHSHVPAKFSTSCHPTFPRFDSWFFHDTFPTNRFPTAAFSRRRSAAFLQTSKQLVQTSTSLADSSPYRSPPSFPSWQLSLTENPSSKCVTPRSEGYFYWKLVE